MCAVYHNYLKLVSYLRFVYQLRSPVSHWRLDPKFYPQLNFIGHLETAQDDMKRLLDILHPDAWEKVSIKNEKSVSYTF